MSQAGLRLRPLNKDDLAQMHAIETSVYEDPWTLPLLEQSFGAPMTHTLGYADEKTDALRAYAIYQVIFNESHLLNLAVHPQFQGKGVGTDLLRALMADSFKKGALSIFLEVRPSNEAGRKLYESHGFRCLMVREKYYSNGEAALILSADLPYEEKGTHH